MATKDRKKLQHIHSSIADKQPTPQSLEVGEIAVNNSAKKEFLSIKNSDDKVVRFSSDSTIIDWIEKKEVMPYSGVVDNVHLDTNRSNIEIKINQVAAKNTPKYDKINGAVDIDGQPVNPSTEGGKEDGAGIAIDMSRYAMIGANPSFSSITVTDKSDLSGNTTIANGDGTGTRIGHTLAIKTTDVTANDTNWTETITNRTSTVTNETNKITTLNESATTRTTIVGTENLTISGATTENKTGNVVENNFSDKTESTAGATNITRTGVVTEDNKNNVTRTTSGSTTETFKGQVTENNQSGYTVNTTGNVIVNTTGTTTETKAGVVTENNLANKTENTTGTHKLYTTGDTCINSQANANFYGKVNTNIGVACDGTTKGSATTVVGTTTLNMSGATTTISGNTTNVTGATTLNLSGNTTNKRALTANTTSTSAYTSATTATTVIGTANTSATTATLSGNTLDITEATRLSAKTPSAYVSGTSLNIVEANTDIESCGRISGKTNAFTIQECATGNGKTVINQTDIKASGKTLSFDETTSISAKTPSTTLSGTNLAVNETTSTINSTNTNLTGTNLSISETNTAINSCGKIEVTTDKYTLKQCSTSGGSAEFEFCNGYTVKSNAINLQQCGTAGTISITAQTQNINGGNLTIRESGATDFSGNTLTATAASNANINVKGNLTEVVTGTTNETHSGAVTINNGAAKTETTTGAVTENNKAGYTVNTTGDTCLQSTADMNVGGAINTNIGTNCDDSVKANYVNIKAKSGVTETANTVTISGTTSASMSGATVNVSGGTANISGATNLNFIGGSITESSTSSVCITGGTTAAFVGTTKTNIGKNCSDGGQTTTLNINGNTINETGATVNVTSSSKTCIQAGTDLNIGGDATTNVGTNCAGGVYSNNVNIYAQTAITETANTVNISGTSAVNVSGATVNVSGGSINETSTGKTCITAGGDLNIGGDANTNVGYNCAGTGIANNTNIYASTAVTINAPKTNITGDTYLSGKTYFHKTCTGLTNNEINDAFCEVLSKGAVTMTKTTPAATSEILATYKLFQNGSQIGEDINIPKDHLLKDVSIVYGKASGSSFTACTSTASDCHWYIKLVWNVFDPSTGHADDKTTYLLADDFIKDIDDENPSGVVADSSYNNVAVKVEYDGKKNVVSATTTPTIHAKENIYADGTVSGATVSAGTLTATGNTTLASASASSISATSISSPTISGTNITASAAIRANNVSANTISANTRINTANLYATDTVSGTNVSAQTINATSTIKSLVISGTNINGVSINGTNISGTTVKGDTISGTNITASNKVTTNALDTNGNVNLSNIVTIDTASGQCVTVNRNLCVNGVVTAQQQIYSSDKNLKENISLVTDDEMDRVANINYKSYNFKNDENKSKIYGVIAQDVQDAGLNELVYTNEDGNLAVDYTSLMILKLAHLRKVNDNLVAYMSNVDYRIAQLEKRIKELEEKK